MLNNSYCYSIIYKKPNNSTETREYDIKGQLTKLVNTGSNGQIINSYTYEYDAAGNVIKENENLYGYDNLNRIISANGRKYSYDNAGNLLTAEKTDTETPEVQEFTYGADNQMATYGLDTTNHDKDGNLLNIPLNGELVTGTYDVRNRLTSIGDTKYFYNAENKRTAVEDNGEITRFVVIPHTALDQVLMETDSNENPTAYYVYGKGLISKGNASGDNSYYHYDRRGSTVALTNDSGEVTDTYTYDIYGEQLTKEGETPNRFLYNGKYGVQTDNNGLYYMRARYYNPEIKRFINRDVIQGSILESQTFNRYSYVNGNPISYIDPFGLSREEDSSLLVNVWNFIVGDDINTLADPNASSLEKVWAGVSIASNFIPGAGPAFKGLKVLTKSSKLLSKGSKKADDIADYIKPCPMNCFVAGTLVETSEGKKPVEDIEIGDKVLAKDDKTGDIEYKEVVDLFNRIAYKTYTISVGETTITVTGEHPFWVQNKGWIETKDLEIGDILTTYDGQELPIDDILIEEKEVTVYNFEVADYHTYFVSELGVWTHNCSVDADGFFEVTLTYNQELYDKGAPLYEFKKKAYALKELGEKGLLVKTKSVRDPNLTRTYRTQLKNKINQQYSHNPEFRDKLLDRLDKMQVDHTWELQVGGKDDPKTNFKMLNSKINHSVGTKQIRKQIYHLPMGSKIKINVVIEDIIKKGGKLP